MMNIASAALPFAALSGRCFCRSVSWKLVGDNDSYAKKPLIGQVLVCHCNQCQRLSGSSNVPYAAIPRHDFVAQVRQSSSLTSYKLSDLATRYFCNICSSLVFMDYHAPNTVWVPIGTIDNFESSWIQIPRDSQIFCENKAQWADTANSLPSLESFGTYKSDVCSGIPFDQLPTWRQD